VTASVLLTVTGTIDPGLAEAISANRRPRADFTVMSATIPADLIDQAAARPTGKIGRAVRRVVGDGVLLAVGCVRRGRRYDVVLTDSERIGMPFAALRRFACRGPRHLMIGHRLSPQKKVLLHRWMRLRGQIDHIVVYSSRQRDVAVEVLGYRPDQVTLMPFMVDTEFWRREHVIDAWPTGGRPLICAVGQELRDYPTFVESVRGLDVDIVIAASSPWSRRADSSAGIDLPDNVTVTGFDHFDLRRLYAASTLVVVPVVETDFQAGITSILEGMAMGVPVVATRTTGQTDSIVDDVTGRYVPPGDAAFLREVIEALLADPAEASRLAANGQQWVREHAGIEGYADRFRRLVGDLV